jgi:hypothetical protein
MVNVDTTILVSAGGQETHVCKTVTLQLFANNNE